MLAEPGAADAEGDGEKAGGDGGEEVALFEEAEGFEAEGGEGGVAAAEAGHEEEAGLGREGAVMGGDEADEQRASEIDREGGPGEEAGAKAVDGGGEAEAGHASQCRAGGDPKISQGW